MKQIINILFLILFGFISFSQNPNTTKYEDKLKTSLTHYESNAIQDTLLRENVANAFSYVIFSNSDVATNSSAFGYSQNKEKTTIAINSNFRIGNIDSPWYIRAGANATGSNNIFEFYGDGSWNNNVGINIGLIRRVGTPSTFYIGEDSAKELIDNRREIYAREIIYNEVKYNAENIEKIIALKKQIKKINIKNKLHENKNYKSILNILPNVKKLLSEKKYEEAFIDLDKEEKKINKYLKALSTDEKLKKYIENDLLYGFDKENDITYGYSLKWLDLNLNLGNSSYKFNEENIDSNIVEDFSNIFKLNEDINKMKSTISLNFNQTHNSKGLIWYYQLGVNGSFGSFLSNSLIDGTPSILQNEDDNFIIQDDKNQTFGLYENIEKTLAVGTLNLYGAMFFTKKKNFGFNISAKHEYLIRKPNGTYHENNFTVLFGPIFRKVKGSETSLTFGIDIGWENGLYGKDVTNDFTGRIRVGVPFNIYSKKKKEEKKSK